MKAISGILYCCHKTNYIVNAFYIHDWKETNCFKVLLWFLTYMHVFFKLYNCHMEFKSGQLMGGF